MKRCILKVMEHGLIVALVVGSAAMAWIGVLSLDSWQGVATLALGAVGFLMVGGMVWAKRKLLAGPAKPPGSGSGS